MNNASFWSPFPMEKSISQQHLTIHKSFQRCFLVAASQVETYRRRGSAKDDTSCFLKEEDLPKYFPVLSRRKVRSQRWAEKVFVSIRDFLQLWGPDVFVFATVFNLKKPGMLNCFEVFWSFGVQWFVVSRWDDNYDSWSTFEEGPSWRPFYVYDHFLKILY